MTSLSPNFSDTGCMRFAALEKAMIDHPENPEALQGYFQEAVAAGNIDHARGVLEQLQHRQPWNHHIRKMLIALSLEQQDHVAAMDAIETLVAFSTPGNDLIDSALSVRNLVGPRIVKENAETGPSISLCMIVKNEQGMLGPCLNSIKALVDELIVIDTGSSDRSADIARIFGARVYHFKWCDDFSAARNYSLEKANGDWILIQDADEIIAPQDHAAFRRIIRRDPSNATAYTLQTRNYNNLVNTMDWRANDRSYPQQETGMGWFPTSKVRLFPRCEDIRFAFPVHELVEPSIRHAGWTIADCPIPVHHYGHINEAKNTRKAHYYFELGYAKLDQLGRDKSALRELAVQAGQLERWPEAIDLWNRFLAICPGYSEAYANIAGAYWQIGRYEQGVDFSRKAIQADPDLKEGHYNLAVNLLMKGGTREAAKILHAILRDNRHYLAASFMLGAALCIIGDMNASRSIFNNLAKELSGDVLNYALGDLAQKFIDSNLECYAVLLQKAVGPKQ